MKSIFRSIFCFAALALPCTAFADIIIKADGTTIECHNIEVSEKYVFYTETPDSDSSKRIAIGEVFGVKIGDGAIQPIASKTAAVKETAETAPTYGPKFVEPHPSADNSQLISAINGLSERLRYKDSEPNDKDTNQAFVMWGLSEESIISDDAVEIKFTPEDVEVWPSYGAKLVPHRLIRIAITNKTNSMIYVDLANTFKIYSDGTSEPYFTNSTYTTSSGGSTGGSLNLGAVAGAVGIGGALGTLASGVNVGGATNSGTQISTTEQQILTIPPHGTAYLPGKKSAGKKSIEEVGECLWFNEADNVSSAAMGLKQWKLTDYDATTSPHREERRITYSTSATFDEYTTLPIYIYVKSVYGVSLRWMKNDRFFFKDLMNVSFQFLPK